MGQCSLCCGKYNGRKYYYDDRGIIMLDIEHYNRKGAFTVTDYYLNSGEKKSVYEYIGNKKYGKQQFFFKSGELLNEDIYVNGKKENSMWYYQNGNIAETKNVCIVSKDIKYNMMPSNDGLDKCILYYNHAYGALKSEYYLTKQHTLAKIFIKYYKNGNIEIKYFPNGGYQIYYKNGYSKRNKKSLYKNKCSFFY